MGGRPPGSGRAWRAAAGWVCSRLSQRLRAHLAHSALRLRPCPSHHSQGTDARMLPEPLTGTRGGIWPALLQPQAPPPGTSGMERTGEQPPAAPRRSRQLRTRTHTRAAPFPPHHRPSTPPPHCSWCSTHLVPTPNCVCCAGRLVSAGGNATGRLGVTQRTIRPSTTAASTAAPTPVGAAPSPSVSHATASDLLPPPRGAAWQESSGAAL